MSSPLTEILIGVVIIEIPAALGGAWAYFRGMRADLTKMLIEAAGDKVADVMRDKAISDVSKMATADHDLLIEHDGWIERHETWSRDRWADHIRDGHRTGVR